MCYKMLKMNWMVVQGAVGNRYRKWRVHVRVPRVCSKWRASPGACCSFWLLTRRNSCWSFTWNSSRCLIKLVVLYPQHYLHPLRHISPHCGCIEVTAKLLLYDQLTHADRLTVTVRCKLQNWVWIGNTDQRSVWYSTIRLRRYQT